MKSLTAKEEEIMGWFWEKGLRGAQSVWQHLSILRYGEP